MDFVSAFAAFSDWMVKLLTSLPAANRQFREEIRAVIGDLADDLSGGLNLVIQRLRAAKRIGDEVELNKYLSESQGKLFAAFSEFRVCADLRNLEDRFTQAFDPTRAAVNLGSGKEIHELITHLENHERLIFDMIQSTWKDLQAMVDAPGAISDRAEVNRQIDKAIADSEQKKAEVTRIARQIIDRL